MHDPKQILILRKEDVDQIATSIDQALERGRVSGLAYMGDYGNADAAVIKMLRRATGCEIMLSVPEETP